ncbi:hypothetical protein L6164_012515 [Bauhinia variegata]|uniref:Uncharacterized protein n=1 Tax=Bauhinia variegata TaxID=167791 RepID=A0ACB9P9B0_BAUVA|nr:hypothetical protein L6164_012515 [Bauhinia variegata]
MVALIAISVHNKDGNNAEHGNEVAENSLNPSSRKNVEMLCQPTIYKETCKNTISKAAYETSDPKELIKTGFNASIEELEKIMNNSTLYAELAKDNMTRQAMDICKEVMDFALDNFYQSIDKLSAFELSKFDEYTYDLKVWLGATITHQQTCLDGFEKTNTQAGGKMAKALNVSMEMSSNALAMFTDFSNMLKNFSGNVNRKLLYQDGDGFPSWVSEGRRRVLQFGPDGVKPNVTVAQDGSGNFTTLTEALKTVPKKECCSLCDLRQGWFV